MPKEDRYLLSMEELEDQIAIMMGGRAAEHLMCGTISTGAVDDIQRATQLAKRMVTEFGMSEKLGSVRYAGQRLQYMGGAIEEASDSSAETRETIDAEVRRIVGEQFARAAALLTAHRDVLADLAADLLRAESLDGSAVREALTARQAAAVKGGAEAVVQRDPAADRAFTEPNAAGRRRVSG
jgi:cell division protease FtsH